MSDLLAVLYLHVFLRSLSFGPLGLGLSPEAELILLAVLKNKFGQSVGVWIAISLVKLSC